MPLKACSYYNYASLYFFITVQIYFQRHCR